MTRSVVFVCSHHTGHINPICSLVPMLLKSGYKVDFFSAESRRAKIEALGAVFHPEQTTHATLKEAALHTVQKKFSLTPTTLLEGELLFEQILPATVAYWEDGFIERVQEIDPAFMVCDVSALWGVLTARLLKVPLVTSCSCTLFDKNSLEPIFGYLRCLEASKKCVDWIKDRSGLDYDPCLSYMNESDFLISWSVPEFQPPSRQHDDVVRYYGAAVPAEIDDCIRKAVDNDLALPENQSAMAFVNKARAVGDAKVKIVYCTLGTVVGQEPWTLAGKEGDMVADFYSQVIKTLGDNADYAVIISIGPNRNVKDFGPRVPSNFFIANCVPQLALLSVVDVFITHCGNNSVHEALFLGTPMLCIPVFGDQHQNAETIVKNKVGVEIESPFKPEISPNLDHVTSDVLYKKLIEILEARKDEILEACCSIKAKMRIKCEMFHAGAIGEIETFAAAKTTSMGAQ